MQIFDKGESAFIKAVLDSIRPERLQQKFLPSPSALEMISTRRMSRQYQEFYSEVLSSTNRASSEPERMALCQ